MSSIMQPDQQLDVFRLLRNMSGHLENVRDDDGVLRFCLRATRDFFRAQDACLARLRHGNAFADIVYEVPKDSEWDRALLACFLRAERPRIPFDHLIVPLWRRARWWGAVCLRRRAGEFERGDGRLLQFVADHVSSILERTDQVRIHDARARLDRKVRSSSSHATSSIRSSTCCAAHALRPFLRAAHDHRRRRRCSSSLSRSRGRRAAAGVSAKLPVPEACATRSPGTGAWIHRGRDVGRRGTVVTAGSRCLIDGAAVPGDSRRRSRPRPRSCARRSRHGTRSSA